MSAAPVGPENAALVQVLEQIQDIAVLPQVVFKVVDLTGSTDSSAREMEAVIVVDPGFSAKLLKLANSAFYGLPRRVTSIREAITFLGFKAVRQLAMTVGVFELFLGKTDTESLRRRAWWRQSVDTGVCARWLASQTTAVSPEESYTCGLLHYVGKTLLDHSSPDKYEFCLAALNAGHDDRSAERIAYGCDHVEVAVAVAEKWGFPEVLTEGLNYVDPPEREDPHRAIRACTCISHHIAQLAIKGKTQIASEDEERALPVWALEALNLPVSKTDFLILEGSAAIRAHAQLAL